eukprot:6183861-Pleurochrysis_carterae.AAC.1
MSRGFRSSKTCNPRTSLPAQLQVQGGGGGALASQITLVTRPVGLALDGRSSRKSVGTPEVVPLRSAPPQSGIVIV